MYLVPSVCIFIVPTALPKLAGGGLRNRCGVNVTHTQTNSEAAVEAKERRKFPFSHR